MQAVTRVVSNPSKSVDLTAVSNGSKLLHEVIFGTGSAGKLQGDSVFFSDAQEELFAVVRLH